MIYLPWSSPKKYSNSFIKDLGFLISIPLLLLMHILDIAVIIPPKETSCALSIKPLSINFNKVSPLFFSLKRLISGGGPFFSSNIFLANIL